MFWYLGTVPFRAVRFVGIVVGIRIYDRRSLYFVDDGTATIQCIYLHPIVKTREKYKPASDLLAPPVQPLCEVGDTVSIVGRVESWRDGRQVTIEDISPSCSGDEIKHWIETSKLHKTYYCEPFSVPPPSMPPPSPVKNSTVSTDDTSINSTLHTSAAVPKIALAVRSEEEEPLRLRHPSRLRSKELSKNVFKIYLKNYMDVLSHYSIRPYRQNHSLLSRSFQIKGFRLSYLRQVPELCTLCKRLVALDSASNDHGSRSSVKKMFVWAIRELIKDGTVVLHDKNGPIWETTNHRTPVWRTPRSDDSRISKSGIMKNSTNVSKYAEEETGEISDPPPKEESYIPLIPEVLSLSIVNILKELMTKSKQRSRFGGPPDTRNQVGLSIGELRHHLNQDMRWEYVGEFIVLDTLFLLEKTGTVQRGNDGRWKYSGYFKGSSI